MNIFCPKIKKIFLYLRTRISSEKYRPVIWCEKLPTKQIRLEVIYVNKSFETNNDVSGNFFICKEEEILPYLTYLKKKYKIYELIETNYKFNNPQILTEFVVTKTEKLLFQMNC